MPGWPFGPLAVLAGTAVAGAAAWLFLSYVPAQRAGALARWRLQLSAMADDRKMALDRWLRDGMGNAATIARYPTLRHELSPEARTRPRPVGVGDRGHLEQLLAEALATRGCRSATVFDAARRAVAQVGTPGVGIDTAADVAVDAIARGAPVAEVRGEPAGRGSGVLFAAPVPGESPGAPALGAVVLEVDARDFLLPFLGLRSAFLESDETLLARREDGDAVFVGPLRHDDRAAPRRRLDAEDLAMADALAGMEDFRRAVDYRGVPILAATRRLESRPWGLLVKVDEAEAMAPVRRLLAWQAAAGLALLGAAAAVAAGLLHGQRVRLAAEVARERARLADLLETTRDAILFVGGDGQILDANERAVRFYGHPRESLVGRHVFDLRAPETAASAPADFERAKKEGALFETVHVRADGSRVPVEVASSVADPRDGTLVSVVRDVSERRAREARIARLNRLYRTLSEVNQALVRAHTERDILDGVCRALADVGGFPLAWVGARRPDGTVEVAARAGSAAAYADALVVRWRDDAPEGRGPTGTAIRDGRAVVLAELGSEAGYAPWRERAEAHGLRSSAAFPVRVEGETWGALMIYGAAPGAIAEEEAALLDRLADDVGYALTMLRTRDRLRALFESDVLGVLFGTADGRILDANDTLLRTIGYGRESLRDGSLRWDAITPPEWLPLDARGVAEARARGSCVPYEKEYVRKDGSRVPVVVGFVLLEPERERSVAFILDISERKRSERRSRLLNERLQILARAVQELSRARDEAAVVEAVRRSARGLVGADVVAFVAREGGECHYVDEDPTAPLWKGRRVPLEACIGGWSMLHGEVVVVEDVESDPRIPHDAYRGTFVRSLAVAPVRRTDSIAAIEAHWRERRRPDDEEVELLQALADATAQAFENVRLYAELERRVAERTAQLEAANRELEGFSSSVSHDLRAPLRAIDGFARILAEDHAGALGAEGRRVLGVVRDSAARMGRLVDDLLRFSRAGRAELRRSPVDMGELVRAALDELPREGVAAADVRVARLEATVGDPALLKQVWTNLLSNALKFTRSRENPQVEVAGRREGRRVVYSVRDNGVGFDERYKDKLFGVFQRLHSGHEFEGTGVGLALVERIVARHGGGVFAESRFGEGATFGFWLPDDGGA